MPNREAITEEILHYKSAGQDIVRRKWLLELSDYTKRDTLVYFSGFHIPRATNIPPAIFALNQQDTQGFMAALHGLKGESLDLILHSPGGSLEVADQLVQYLRAKYKHIRAIVPQNAMSAATMLACACDEILMGKHSAIGPIDPQIQLPGPNGVAMSVPAHTILKDFDQAKAEVLGNPVLANIWVPKLQSVPVGFLNFCEQTIQLAKIKVETWLAQYMFQGQNPALAKSISDFLGNFDEHKTHGRPIGFEVAQSVGLKVGRIEDDAKLQELILSVFHSTMVTFEVTTCLKLIENQFGKGHYVVT
jgi:hypothetical protein